MVAPETGKFLIRRILLSCLILAGCTEGLDDPEPVPSTEADPAPVVSKDDYGSSRDSIAAAFLRDPESVLSRMSPERAPEDVWVASALLEVSGGEGKLRFVQYLVDQEERSVDPLIALVEQSEDWNTLVSAIQTLGKLRAGTAVGAVSARFRSQNDWVRMAAAHALGEIAGDTASKALVRALDDSSDTVISAVLIAMGKAGDRGAVRHCARYLEHGNPRVRSAAVSAIGRLGDREDLSLLQRLSEDPDEGVRYKVKQAAAAIRAGSTR